MTASGPAAGERILDMADLGARGDGIARTGTEPVYVPFSLPGERVRAAVSGNRGTLIAVETPSPDRVAPVCRHFTHCGGCAMQHLAMPAYKAWKRGLVVTALAHRGITTPVGPLVDAHGAGRRRVTLHVAFAAGVPQAGFMAARSHALADLDACPVLAPPLAAAPDMARALARPFAKRGKPFDIHLTATDSGIDADLRGVGAPGLDASLKLPEIAERLDLARITADGALVVERRTPVLTVGRVRVTLPPGVFLQATATGEAVLATLVGRHAEGVSAAADLFSGIGPFALRLAATASVDAFDSETAALDALDAAARHTSGLKPVTATRRDLFRDPLTPVELARYDAVVFDPPRAGAEAQARELAAASVPAVIAVSCDPASFARDAAILIDGGYRLDRATPVDQFRYAPHVELVTRFSRPA